MEWLLEVGWVRGGWFWAREQEGQVSTNTLGCVQPKRTIWESENRRSPLGFWTKFTTPLGASTLAIFCVLTQTIQMEASTITVVKLKTQKKAWLFYHCDPRPQSLSQRGVGTGQKDLLRDFSAPKICMTQKWISSDRPRQLNKWAHNFPMHFVVLGIVIRVTAFRLETVNV